MECNPSPFLFKSYIKVVIIIKIVNHEVHIYKQKSNNSLRIYKIQ